MKGNPRQSYVNSLKSYIFTSEQQSTKPQDILSKRKQNQEITVPRAILQNENPFSKKIQQLRGSQIASKIQENNVHYQYGTSRGSLRLVEEAQQNPSNKQNRASTNRWARTLTNKEDNRNLNRSMENLLSENTKEYRQLKRYTLYNFSNIFNDKSKENFHNRIIEDGLRSNSTKSSSVKPEKQPSSTFYDIFGDRKVKPSEIYEPKPTYLRNSKRIAVEDNNEAVGALHNVNKSSEIYDPILHKSKSTDEIFSTLRDYNPSNNNEISNPKNFQGLKAFEDQSKDLVYSILTHTPTENFAKEVARKKNLSYNFNDSSSKSEFLVYKADLQSNDLTAGDLKRSFINKGIHIFDLKESISKDCNTNSVTFKVSQRPLIESRIGRIKPELKLQGIDLIKQDQSALRHR